MRTTADSQHRMSGKLNTPYSSCKRPTKAFSGPSNRACEKAYQADVPQLEGDKFSLQHTISATLPIASGKASNSQEACGKFGVWHLVWVVASMWLGGANLRSPLGQAEPRHHVPSVEARNAARVLGTAPHHFYIYLTVGSLYSDT